VGLPLIIPVIIVVEKYRNTVLQRLGILPLPERIRQYRTLHPNKKPVWIHALSVGEVLSAVQLVKQIKTEWTNYDIIFSVSTKTGFDIAKARLQKDVWDIFYFPYDLLFSVKHVLCGVDPALALIVETDIWPNFLEQMKKRNIPVILVNARLSDRSFTGYMRFRSVISKVLDNFAAVCVQTRPDAKCFRLLGVSPDKLFVTGNFKFDQPYKAADSSGVESLRTKMNLANKDKVFLAGSTHKGEEAILSNVFSKMKKDSRYYRFIVAPRNPKRADSIRRIFESTGLSVLLMKDLCRIDGRGTYDVLVVDVIGLLRDLYALADCAFIGGSLVSRGGHNPLEPAAFSKPIVFGRDMSSFTEISQMLLESGGAVQVKGPADLYKAATMLINDEKKGQTMGTKAYQVFVENQGAVAKTLNVIAAFLPDELETTPNNN
jgi:3-deoxy-D-manno-octulosonic-acid transferase